MKTLQWSGIFYLTSAICIFHSPALSLAPCTGPGPRPRPPALAPNLYLLALAHNLYLPSLAPNL